MSGVKCCRCGAVVVGVSHIDFILGKPVCQTCFEMDLCEC